MIKYLRPLKRIVSVLMIFILLIQQFGCVNSKIITSSDLPSYYPKYAYVIHCQKSVYVLEKVGVSNDTLSGKVFNPEWEVLQTSNFIHIYPASDSLVMVNSAKVLSLPLSGIIKVVSKEKARGKTSVIVVGGIILAVLVLAGLAFSTSSGSINMGP